MVKVLEVNVDDNGYGGVYAFILNILENIGKEFQIDLCSFEKFEKQSNIDYVESFGGTVHYCGHSGRLFEKQLGSLKNLYNLVKQEKYNVIHIHSDVSYKLFLYALSCKLAGSKNILIHSHSTGVDGKHRVIKRILQNLFKTLLPLVTKQFLACSEKAARWMYSANILKEHKYIVINNGIELNKFRFNGLLRNKKRMELDLKEDDFVIGHIGRFSYQKNHPFLIDIFDEILKKNHNAKLLLIGNYVGDPFYLNECQKKVHDLGIDDFVFFLGLRNDVPELMQAMDCFLLPSRFEGLPIVGIEAQAAGLPCYFSDAITQELNITNLAHFISLNLRPQKWAEEILSIKHQQRKDMRQELEQAGYDINKTIEQLESFYLGEL